MKTRKEQLGNKDKPTTEEKEEYTKLEKEINWATYALYDLNVSINFTNFQETIYIQEC
jgi:hypothetical protein